jgi:diguanylate cyclase (GGDEF)-like protein
VRYAERPANLFNAAVVVLGACVFVSAASRWGLSDPTRFGALLVIAVVATSWKYSSPALPGPLSLGLLFLLLALADFGFDQALILSVAMLLVRWATSPAERPGGWHGLVRLGSLVVALAVADAVFQAASAPTVPLLWPLLAAASVFSLASVFPVAVIKASAESRSLPEIWHEYAFWTLPCHLLGALVAAGVLFLAGLAGWQKTLFLLPFVLLLYRLVHTYLERAQARRTGTELLATQHHRTLEALGLAIGARFRAADQQMSRAQTYALWIADDLELDPTTREALRIGTVLRDVGLLAVPEPIISKRGHLSDEEYAKIKLHPVVGASIVERAEFPVPVTPIVRHHHERWDGRGYPDGLAGQEIPAGARILAVVDALVALTSERPHRAAISFRSALSFLASQSGVAFDPDVVDVVLRRAPEFERLCREDPGARAGEAIPAPDFVAHISGARRETQEVYEIAQEVGQSANLLDTLARLAGRLQGLLEFDCLVFWLLRRDKLVAECVAGSAAETYRGAELPIGAGVSGSAACLGRPVRNGDPGGDVVASGRADPVPMLGSALAVPLEGSRETVGVVTLYRRERQGFGPDDVRILFEVRSQLAAAVENAIRLEEAAQSATTDYLTGLPNARSLRDHLDSELARCRREDRNLTVLLGDLDGFKAVNDSRGHLEGDKVLRAVGRALAASCREYDYVARLGGDEFVVVLPGLPSGASAGRRQALESVVREAAQDASPGCGVSLSLGEARYPQDGGDAETLLGVADSRMYRAKARRKPAAGSRGYDFDWIEAGFR